MDTTTQPLEILNHGPIDCACVIYGDVYPWIYVDKLYNMLSRNISAGVRFHVYTEAHRIVPSHYIKHELTDWKIGGPKKAWWYKMQLFNSAHHAGPLLYFDLDTVVVNNIDWLWRLPLNYFWTIRDFKYLWRPTHYGINSSVMWWDTVKYHHVWETFSKQRLDTVMRRHRGDQDFLTQTINKNQYRFFQADQVKSWRWQALDGGYDFSKKQYQKPGAGTYVDERTSILVFHGEPKPDQVSDSHIEHFWK